MQAITETNSGPDAVAPRLAYIAVGEFGAPILAPWALNVSYPKPHVLKDGSLANGAFALRDTFSSISKAILQISYYAGTDKLKVFMARVPGQKFSHTEDVDGFRVTVTGEDNGQVIVIHSSGHEFLIVGYRCGIEFKDPAFEWPAMKGIRVERGYWAADHWAKSGEPSYGINQSDKTLGIDLETAQAVRISW